MSWSRATDAACLIEGKAAKVVFSVIAPLVDKDSGKAWMAVPQIAARAMISERTVYRGLRELREQRVIDDGPKRKHGSNTYIVHPIFVERSSNVRSLTFQEAKDALARLQGKVAELAQPLTVLSQTPDSFDTKPLTVLSQTPDSFVTHTELEQNYEQNLKQNPEDARSAVAPDEGGKAVDDNPLPLTVADSPSKRSRKKKEPQPVQPEVAEIVSFWQTIYRDRFPVEPMTKTWVFQSRAAAVKLLRLGNAAEVKERIRRCHTDFRRKDPAGFGALRILVPNWSLYAMPRSEAEVVAGMQVLMSDAKVASSTQVSASSSEPEEELDEQVLADVLGRWNAGVESAEGARA